MDRYELSCCGQCEIGDDVLIDSKTFVNYYILSYFSVIGKTSIASTFQK